MASETESVFRYSAVVVTCEHAGNEVPAAYASCFAGAEEAIQSHRGWDPGTLGVGLRLSTRLAAPLVATTTTRLLVEANRSLHATDLFSAYTRGLSGPERSRIIEDHYLPHRRTIEGLIRSWIHAGERVLHLAVHSFTDVLDGIVRDMDLGLLYDPARTSERTLCESWAPGLVAAGGLRVAFNRPYLGTDDGLTTFLRTMFPDDSYTGIEIELRQGLLGLPEEQVRMGDLLSATLPGGPSR